MRAKRVTAHKTKSNREYWIYIYIYIYKLGILDKFRWFETVLVLLCVFFSSLFFRWNIIFFISRPRLYLVNVLPDDMFSRARKCVCAPSNITIYIYIYATCVCFFRYLLCYCLFLFDFMQFVECSVFGIWLVRLLLKFIENIYMRNTHREREPHTKHTVDIVIAATNTDRETTDVIAKDDDSQTIRNFIS